MAEQESFEALSVRVLQWIDADPDPETRGEAQTLLETATAGDTEAAASLVEAFAGRLAFGTAGLRARLGAGPRRMNRMVIGQSTAGLAEYLLARAERGECANPPTVIIGFDARVNSDVFAREAAEVFAGAGLKVTLMPKAAPTPLTAFAVAQLDYSAGVMITASHNPPDYNGYKVYLGDADHGSQIAHPADLEVASLIETSAQTPFSSLARSLDYRVSNGALDDAYVEQTVASLTWAAPDHQVAPFVAVYTAMHGVGSALSARVFERAGLPDPLRVSEQDVPDGNFPTLPYPNPEESGALDLAFDFAQKHGAHLVIAQDPDADRLALAVPDPELAGEFRRLSGNELGLLLGWRAAERERVRAIDEGRAPSGSLANTRVSSPALGAVARVYGLDHVETLSGFKWVSRVPNLRFGFEESLGYLSNPEVLRDKDGISAALEAYAMVFELHAQGRTIWDHLDEASERFGHFASRQIVMRFTSSVEVSAVTARLRADPPSAFAGIAVEQLHDLSRPGAVPVAADVLSFELVGGSRVMVRPSGTEPKLKVYLDTCVREGSALQRREQAEQSLDPIEHAVREAILRLLQ